MVYQIRLFHIMCYVPITYLINNLVESENTDVVLKNVAAHSDSIVSKSVWLKMSVVKKILTHIEQYLQVKCKRGMCKS